jgi:four helix bundle protein
MKIGRFEDLIAWQKARDLTKQYIKPFSSDFGLRVQIQRATVSVMSNLAEGLEKAAVQSSSVYCHSKGFMRGSQVATLQCL